MKRRGSWALARKHSTCECYHQGGREGGRGEGLVPGPAAPGGRQEGRVGGAAAAAEAATGAATGAVEMEGGREGGKEGGPHTPTTRMMLCAECNRGLRRQETIGLRRADTGKEGGREAGPVGTDRPALLLLLLWAVILSLVLVRQPGYSLVTLSSALFFYAVYRLTVVPSSLGSFSSSSSSSSVSTGEPSSSPPSSFLEEKEKAVWSLGVVGLVHALAATLVALLLSLGFFSPSSSSSSSSPSSSFSSCPDRQQHRTFSASDFAEEDDVGREGGLPPLLTVQLLVSSGYYAFNLLTQIKQRLQRRHPISLAWQTLLLLFYTATLLHTTESPSPSPSSSPPSPSWWPTTDSLLSFFPSPNTIHLQRLLLLAILGELHNGLVLLRDLLVLAQHLTPPPSDIASFLRRQHHSSLQLPELAKGRNEKEEEQQEWLEKRTKKEKKKKKKTIEEEEEERLRQEEGEDEQEEPEMYQLSPPRYFSSSAHQHHHIITNRSSKNSSINHLPPSQNPSPRSSSSSRTRLASLIWISIWATFFLCQCFPMLYFFFLLLSATPFLPPFLPLVVEGLGGREGGRGGWVSSAALGGGALALGVYLALGRMRTLSERFQLDFWKPHY